MGFVHLHLHTEYSLLDGCTKIVDLFDKVKELGMDTVAVTEHGNLHSIITKYKLAKKAGVKLIFGMEAYLSETIKVKDKTHKRYHLLLLAKNYEGYQNLIRLSSIANCEGFYYKPRIDMEVLKKHSKGLICTSACIANDIAQAIIHDDIEKAKDKIRGYIEIFGKEDFYLEVENHGIPEEDKVREAYYVLAEEFGIKVVATTDSHYLEEKDAKAHEVMLCIQTNSTIDNPKHFKFNGSGFHVKNETEMRELFPDHPEVIDNTVDVASKCNVELELGESIFPNFELPSNISHADYLHQLCLQGIEVKYKGSRDYEKAKSRMEFELSVINKMGFATYFLIVYDFIKAAKKRCQVGPGRGSGAGSIVAYLLGITQLEPISLGLLFERFLNPERVSMPDFDVDFGDKDVVLEYVREKYGEDKLALIGTFGTMSAKAVIKDVARVFGVPFTVSNEITKHIHEKTIDKSLNAVDDKKKPTEESKLLKTYEQQYPEVFTIARRLEGCVRHKGIHACGVVWGKKEITEYMPVSLKDGIKVTQIDKNEVEDVGLVKFDFLGLETLNITKKVLKMIDKPDEWLENLTVDDDEVYKMLRHGDSVGTFQMESPGMQNTLKLVKPTNFDDIIAILALYRPGSMDFIDIYARRKDGKEKVPSIHPDTDSILMPTYGILVYQEQVMQISRALANFTMGESDVLRKAIGKKKLDLMMKMETKFKEGCKRFAKMEEKAINTLWDNIVKFASYSFNKSHAAAYALISYRTAYLRKYHPVEFMTAVISANTNDPEKMSFYIEAARNMDIKMLPPEINFSQPDFSVESSHRGKCIRFGLSGIKNVGGEALNEIINNRPYNSYQDVVNKVDLSKVNKRVLKNLITTGCFDNLQHNRAQLLAVYEKVCKDDDCNEKQMTLFGNVAKSVTYPNLEDFSLKKKLEIEKELLGVYISGHPMDLYQASRSKAFTKISNLREDSDAEIFGLIKRYNKVITKNGDDMAFMSIVNKNDECNVVIFPNLFEDMRLGQKEMPEETGVIVEGKFKDGSLLADQLKFPKMLEN